MNTFRLDFYVHQVLTILGLYAAGWGFLALLPGRMYRGWKALLAYPAGLSLWGVGGFVLLCLGIPFRPLSVFLLLVLVCGCLLLCRIAGGRTGNAAGGPEHTAAAVGSTPGNGTDSGNGTALRRGDVIFLLGTALCVIVLALLCCSGLIPVSISNDSVYYYSLYPQTLAKEGAYLGSYDVFLTDVGQVTAVIGTLPFFFGFAETFGIQLFLEADLTAVFFAAVYELAGERQGGVPEEKETKAAGKRRALLWAAGATLILVTSTPYQIMTRWVLANAYFMAFLFLLFVLAKKAQKTETGRPYLLLSALMIVSLSAMRMEGGMIAGLLILCFCGMEFAGGDLLKYYVLPVGVTQILYYGVVYLKLSVSPLYSFLSFKNAFVMIAFLLAITLYIALVRRGGIFAGIRTLRFWETRAGRLIAALSGSYYSLTLAGALLLADVALTLLDPERSLGNLMFFGKNIILQSGWGYFGFFVLLVLMYLAARGLAGGKGPGMSCSGLFSLCFFLFTFALCWARGGSLRLGVGDSGNRVLMQVVPLVVYALTEALMGRKEGQDVPGKE